MQHRACSQTQANTQRLLPKIIAVACNTVPLRPCRTLRHASAQPHAEWFVAYSIDKYMFDYTAFMEFGAPVQPGGPPEAAPVPTIGPLDCLAAPLGAML